MPATKIVVVGSLNLDLVTGVDNWPAPGETRLGKSFAMIPGGKGANQAVAAARLGADVAMVGRVGEDAFADTLLLNLANAGVSTDRVLKTSGASTGLAAITVCQGENSIVVVPGANHLLTVEDVEEAESVIARADILLLQNEIPLETALAARDLAVAHAVRVIFDPAPAPASKIPDRFWNVDLLSPNCSEASVLAEIDIQNRDDADRAAEVLHAKGASLVIMKLGDQGALWCEGGRPPIHVPAFTVKVVDSTAAGDAFTAALAVAWSEGRSPQEILRFACAAGGLAVTRAGAQPSLPTRAEVEQLLAAH